MKTYKLIATLIVTLAAVTTLGARAYAATATADAKAEIVAALDITKETDLDFAQVVAGGTDGTVIMTPGGVRSATGGTTLGNGPGSAASFHVTGAANATYAITLPSSVTLESGLNTMLVDTFTSDPTPTGTLDGTGNQTLNVGATLHVPTGQATGNYSHSFDVTVAYN